MRSKLLLGFVIGFFILGITISGYAVNWPLRISANGKYLEDQDGVPFFIAGEAAWSMAAQLSPSDVITYLDDRQAKGFTAIILNAIEHEFSSHPPYNYAGQHPFSNGNFDWSVRNEAYWSHLDYILNEAKKRDILVFLFPAYLGYQCAGEGWCGEMMLQTDTVMTGYGEWLGNRYTNQGNIVWVHGGDANAKNFAGAYSRVVAIANGIRSKDGSHLHTAHSSPESSALDDYAGLIDLNTTYSYSDPQKEVQNDYQRVSALPFTYIEGTYENEHSSTVIVLQRQALTAYLGGALLGHVFGNCPMWHFGSDSNWCGLTNWQAQLDSAGSKFMANIGSLMKSCEWWKLEPDYSSRVVVSGKSSGTSYKAAARTSDGKTIIIWFPAASQATVDMSQINGIQAKAWWWDPKDNTSALIGTYTTTCRKNFTPNKPGMVLIIEADNAGACDAMPTADFFGSPTSGTSPMTVNFTDKSNNCATAWYWDFSDGQTSTLQNPIHTYNNEGNYSVSLTVTNACGSNTIKKSNYVSVTQPNVLKIHVNSTRVMSVTVRSSRFGQAYVTVVNGNNSPVAGAVVYGFFNYPNNTIKSSKTGTNGVALISSDKVNKVVEFCFRVTKVVLKSAEYDSSKDVCAYACMSGCRSY